MGLHELQELGTLSDTEAASLLYNLSAGLDRVSLVSVMKELASSRNGILDADGQPCQVLRLLAERAKLRGEIDELNEATGRFGQLCTQRDRLKREVSRLEEEGRRLQFEARVLEIAVSARGPWRRRAEQTINWRPWGPRRGCPREPSSGSTR